MDERRKGFFRQAIKFGLVGVLNTAVTFLGFLLLHRALGVNEYLANAVSYALGLVNGFFWNKFWTFRSPRFDLAEIGLFLLVFLVCYGIQLAAYRGLRLLGLRPELAQALAMVAYTALNFCGNKLITFRKGEVNA